MIQQQAITCVIPFHNEGRRLFHVLDMVKQINGISKIIVVDDGSTDNASPVLVQKYPSVELVRLPNQSGKAHAIKMGLQQVQTPFTLTIDADLKDIHNNEITRVLEILHPGIDMVILRRVHAPWYIKVKRADLLFSGERILKTQDLKAILEQGIENYQLEFAINQYMLEQGKKAYWAPWSAKNTYKASKEGFVKGMIKDFAMYMQIMRFAGAKGFLKQYFEFYQQTAPLFG
jgi:glycosyltransferase involved in cell wall biosynthesis